MRVVFVGLSITSSWGNGHATNYRALVRELAARGHEVLFCEWDAPWYAAHRDLERLEDAELCLYRDLDHLRRKATADLARADLVIVGSYIRDGAEVIGWLLSAAGGPVAFYDIDTPITLAALTRGDCEYLSPELIPRFSLYLSFTGGPALAALADQWGATRPVAFHCLVDPEHYRPVGVPIRWSLGYLGTYSADRQPSLENLLVTAAQRHPDWRCVVAGPGYPERLEWPPGIERIEHLGPSEHPAFYGAQRFTLNVTRADMRRLGYSPSVRLFEAAACGTPIISDRWPGLDGLFRPGEEILVADSAEDVERFVAGIGERERQAIAARARQRVLEEHTAARRIDQLEAELAAVTGDRRAA